MSKTIPQTPKSRKSAKNAPSKNTLVDPLPAELSPAVVEAVLEDALLSAAADEAALTADLPPTSDLEGIPYLGETRRQALARAGLGTKAELRRVTVEQIGGVKGVGMVNAARVKAWLSAQPSLPPPAAPNFDPALAESNQHVQDVFQKLGSAAARLKDHLPAKARDKALDRQLEKLDTVASELAEGPDTLSAKQVQDAVKTLDKIAALLETAAGAEKLSPKKQAVLIEELRARRKRLQKTLGD